jgi:hypothetical protein
MFRKREEKLRLSRDEEFQLLTLVFDKVLWLGTIAAAFGVYSLVTNSDVWFGLLFTFIGAMILMIFTAIVVREIHLHKRP